MDKKPFFCFLCAFSEEGRVALERDGGQQEARTLGVGVAVGRKAHLSTRNLHFENLNAHCYLHFQ